MPTRPKKRQKSAEKKRLSKESVLELARQPRTLIIAGCLGLATIVTVVAFQSGSDSVTDADPTDQQLDDALGALGISNSANPSSGSVNTNFNFDDKPEPEQPKRGSEAGFLSRSTVSSSPDFEPSFDDDGPKFGRPIIVNDPRSELAVKQAGFQQPENAPSQAIGARVTANQAVWLTGSIETR